MDKFGARTKKWRLNLCRNRYVINAPISRVLPTPVANAKQRDGKSRSKSVTVLNSDCIVFSALLMSSCKEPDTTLSSANNSATLARISTESRCGARRLRRFARAFTSEFIGYGSPRQPPRITAWSRPCSSFVHWWERPRRAQGIGALPADF